MASVGSYRHHGNLNELVTKLGESEDWQNPAKLAAALMNAMVQIEELKARCDHLATQLDQVDRLATSSAEINP